jgi:ribosomal protein S18 acetylase RimI-like enzyme
MGDSAQVFRDTSGPVHADVCTSRLDRIDLPGQETLLACWSALARLSSNARLIDSPAASAAVFPAWQPLNNAIVRTSHDGIGAAAAAASQLANVYAHAGVDVWALWVPSSATALDAPDHVQEVGRLKRDTTTLVMQASLSTKRRLHEGVLRTSVAAVTRAGDEPVPVADLGPPEADPGLDAWVMVQDDVAVTGAWSFLHQQDCGIYAVGTLPAWRRQGLARLLVEHVLADAQRRGAETATLQSTRMGQRLYESLGFEAVGRYEEWISQ